MSIERLSYHNEAARTYLHNAETARASSAQTAGDGGAKVGVARRPDSVSLSASARTLATARAAVQQAPDVREAKVAEIKQRVQNGTYTVPARVLARNLIAASSNSATS
jgi:negative regulator of flagellin synthesis FlgM